MRRRKFLQLASGAAISWPLPTFAQQGSSIPLVAVITPLAEKLATERTTSIREGLTQAGLVEGKDYVLTLRFASGDYARLASLISEVDELKPRLYVVVGGGITVLHQQLPSAQIVFTGVAIDPIGLGWARSYARPGGVITGNVQNAAGGLESLLIKQLSLFKQLVPSLSRVGFIGLADTAAQFPAEHIAMQKASAQVGFALSMYEVATPDDVDSAIASGTQDGVDGFYLSGDPKLISRLTQIVVSLAKTGKPAAGPYPLWTRGGLLMSYYTDPDDQARRAGSQVAKILHGAKPADLPIEQATKFTLIINLKTAKRLGITVPPTLLAQADEVIE